MLAVCHRIFYDTANAGSGVEVLLPKYLNTVKSRKKILGAAITVIREYRIVNIWAWPSNFSEGTVNCDEITKIVESHILKKFKELRQS